MDNQQIKYEEVRARKTEDEVLRVYQEVNPSTHLIENKEVFDEHSKIKERLFRDKLKFPPEMFKDKSILDFGSGTGENCSFYLRWRGQKLTCVEMNRLALDRLNQLYSKWGLDKKTKVHNCSLFDFESKGEEFDIVTCDGILNHVEYPELAFKKLISNLKNGGYAIISIGNSSGAFQRNLQKYALFKLSNNQEEKIVENAKLLFPEHIDRASRFGRRTAEAVIYDTFINPKTTNVSVSDVLQWFRENGITFYSSWPPLQFPFALVDSVNHQHIKFEDLKYQELFSFSELFWLTADKYDSETIEKNRTKLIFLSELGKISEKIKDITLEFASGFDLNKFLEESKNIKPITSTIETLNEESVEKLSSFFSEVLSFLETLNSSNNIELIKTKMNNFKFLFKGYCGLGEVFYVGYKTENKE